MSVPSVPPIGVFTRRLGLAMFACLGLGCFQEPPTSSCDTDISCAENADTTGRAPESDGADATTSGSSGVDDDTRSSTSSTSMGSAGPEETSGTAPDTDSSETSGTGGSTSGTGDSGAEETGETTSGDGGAATLNGSRVATNCILACDFTANPSQCPAGSSCKDVGQGGVVGTCTYP